MPLTPWTPPVNSRVAGDDPDDLAEAQGHDGQVVTAQPQRRRAEEDPGDMVNAMASGMRAAHATAHSSERSNRFLERTW